MAYDILIKRGTIVDGSGRARYQGDVGVRAGRIVDVGRVTGGASKTIDAEGLVVAPGFIDMHTHYDAQLLWDPLATPSSWHGFTTVLTGNCGFTIAPCRPPDYDYIKTFMSQVEGMPIDVLRTLEFNWDSFGGYLDRLRKGLGVNVVAQVGHSALRYYVMGEEAYQGPCTEGQLERMKEVLHESFAAGAMGFSTTFQTVDNVAGRPVPSRMGTWEEPVELARVLKDFPDGIVQVSPYPGGATDPGITPEFKDVIRRLAAVSGHPVVWSSFKTVWNNPGFHRGLLDFMEQANREGHRVYAVTRAQRSDLEFNLRFSAMFQFNPGVPTLRDIISRPHDEKKRLLRDPEVRAKLRTEWDGHVIVPGSPVSLEIVEAVSEKNKALVGKKLADIAAGQGRHVVDLMLDIALEEDLGTQFVFMGRLNGDDNLVREIVTSPYAIAGVSDAGAHVDMECAVDFGNILIGKWARDLKALTLEDAVRRLTHMGASTLGLTDRGLIKEGMAADIVVFDLESMGGVRREIVADLPGGGRRVIKRASAVRAVVVNGELLMDDNRHTGALPGKVLSGH